MAQLVINRLELPFELHCIIKDFALPSKERKQIMVRKQYIHAQLNYAYLTICTRHHYIQRWFKAYGETHELDFESAFCILCGNYADWTNTPAICNC